MPAPTATWIDDLPTDRLIGEFSPWSGDLLHLGDDLIRIGPFADILHVDVADGHFAPAMLFFPDFVAAIRKACSIPIHIHMMVTDDTLLAQIAQFAEAGGNLISVHAEKGRQSPIVRSIFSMRRVSPPAWFCRSRRPSKASFVFCRDFGF